MKTLNIKTILVPVDFSKTSIEAIESAKRLALRFDATVHLVHVHEFCHPAGFTPAPIGLPAAVPDWSITVAQQMGERLLRELKELATRFGISPDHCHLQHGAPVFNEICMLGRELSADLIVTPTHGYTGLKHVFLGSTAERIVQHSPCPVLVTKKPRGAAPYAGVDHILVPVDFSPCSLAGLHYAIQLAEKFAARITVLHVVNFGSAFTADGYAMCDLTQYKEIARQEAERDMTAFLRSVKFGGVRFDTEVVADLFLDGINGAIAQNGIDLVVTATHGYSGLKHVLIGSTAELIVRRAACPVLVVPSHPQERARNLATSANRSSQSPQKAPRNALETDKVTKRFRKLIRHPFPERRKTNKFRETHQLASR